MSGRRAFGGGQLSALLLLVVVSPLATQVVGAEVVRAAVDRPLAAVDRPRPAVKGFADRPHKTRSIQARVIGVVDGGLIAVRASGKERALYKVRLIGVDAPALGEGERPGECGAAEAKDNLRRLAFDAKGRGRTVRLIFDPGLRRLDRLRHLLAYVRSASGADLNIAQIEGGFARVQKMRKPFRRLGMLNQAQDSAQRAKRGIWTSCDAVRVAGSGQAPPGGKQYDVPASNVNDPRVPATWRRYAGNPLFTAGFDVWSGGPLAIAIGDPSVLYDEQEGRWKMWFGVGWFLDDQMQIPRLGIKYAESPNGIDWRVDPGLALGPSEDPRPNGDPRYYWDHTHTETPSVVKNPDAPPAHRYMLWYSGANDDGCRIFAEESCYQIGFAFSADGRHFTRLSEDQSLDGEPGLSFKASDAFPGVPNVKGGIAADPEVMLKDGIYRMWFSTVGLDDEEHPLAAGIGYAISSDGIHWHPSLSNPVMTLRNLGEEGPAQPAILWNPKRQLFEMWFTNDWLKEKADLPKHGVAGFWRAVSGDGEKWTADYRQRDFSWDKSLKNEDYNLWTGVDVVLKDDLYSMFYGAEGSAKLPPSWRVGDPVLGFNLATRPAE